MVEYGLVIMDNVRQTRSKTTPATTFLSLPSSTKTTSTKSAAVQCTLPLTTSSTALTSPALASTTPAFPSVVPPSSGPSSTLPSAISPTSSLATPKSSSSDDSDVATPPTTPPPLSVIPVGLPPPAVHLDIMADAAPAADLGSDDRFINVQPPSFSGSTTDDAFTFVKAFERYATWKRVTDDNRKCALFAVLLHNNAATWYDTLSTTDKSTFTNLRAAFDARYLSPATVKHQSARTIFTRKQSPSESTDDYIAAMRRHAQLIEADDSILRYALMSGFQPHIANFVLQQKAESINEIVEAARLAELTNVASSSSSDNALILDQLMQLQTEVRRLGRDRTSTVTSSRSPTPERPRVVTFAASPADGRRHSPTSSSTYTSGLPSNATRQQQPRRGLRQWHSGTTLSTPRCCLRCARPTCSGARGECVGYGKICFRCNRPQPCG